MNDRIRLNRTYPYLLMVALLVDVLHENFGGTRSGSPVRGAWEHGISARRRSTLLRGLNITQFPRRSGG
ncbi:MAG: hypothetical protein WBI57_03710 [Desulfobacterales bacterium]